MVEAIQIATEGRVRALYEAAIQSSVSNLHATGTGTDCIAVVSLDRGRSAYCGKHTQLGELIGRAAYAGGKNRTAPRRPTTNGAPRGDSHDDENLVRGAATVFVIITLRELVARSFEELDVSETWDTSFLNSSAAFLIAAFIFDLAYRRSALVASSGGLDGQIHFLRRTLLRSGSCSPRLSRRHGVGTFADRALGRGAWALVALF